ncbi:MAG: TolC family protein [Ferruginibacter sp.]|nr:TolC family protein [Ferruginibacter sp.]
MKNIEWKIVYLLPLFFLGNVNLSAQQKNEFTVKQAVEYGIKNATAVKNALLDIKIQKQTNKEIEALAYPQLNASGTFNDFIDIPTSLLPGEIFQMPGTRIPVQFGTKYNATGSIDASQILFDGQVFIGLKARKTAMQLANNISEVTVEQIKANIYKIYYQLVVGKKQVSSVDANIERFEKLLNDVTQIYKQGFAEKLDIDKVQVQLNNLRTEKIKIDNQLESGNAGLKFLMNMPQKDILVLTDTVNEESLKENILNDNYDYKNRKEFVMLSNIAKMNEYNIRRYRLSRIPTIVAFGSYQKNAQRSTFDFFGKGNWFTTSLVGLKLAAPLFDGNARRAKIKKAQFELEKTNNTLEQTKANVDYEVNAAKIKIKSALLTIDNQKQNVTLAEKVYNTTKKKYEAGLGSNQEIYNAQTELKVAQTNYYAAMYDAVIAKIDYLKAVGKL